MVISSNFFFQIALLISILISVGYVQQSGAATLVEFEKERFQVELKKARTDAQIVQTSTKISELQERLKSRKKYLSRRLRALQYLQSFRWGSLLAIENSQQLEKNLKTLKFINQYDLAQLQEYKFAQEELGQQQKLLLKQSDNLKKYAQQLLKQERDIRKLEDEVLRDLRAGNQKSLLLFKGDLPKPVDGQLVQSYGPLADPENQYSVLVKGHTYSVKSKSLIQAVGPGVVIFRDQIPYWGESVLVQHDGEYYSVYTHTKNCQVKVGDSVQAGEKICETGADKFYFELRHQTVAINPKRWLKE